MALLLCQWTYDNYIICDWINDHFQRIISSNSWIKLGFFNAATCFYGKIEWPKVNKSFLTDEEIIIVVQINGKKRGLISTKKDVSEKEVLAEAKKIENVEKNLKDKKILKNIFVKNKIINFITAWQVVNYIKLYCVFILFYF